MHTHNEVTREPCPDWPCTKGGFIMSSYSKECGCYGGDGDCSGGGGWFDPCEKYPRCGHGLAEAKELLLHARRDMAKEMRKDKENEARAVALAKLTAKERRLLGL